MNDYFKLKQALLAKFLLRAEDYSGKCYKCKQGIDETASQYLSRLDHCLSQWITLAGIGKTFKELKELFLRVQFLHSCPRELGVLISERSPSNMEAIKELADVYTASHSTGGIKETIKRNDRQDKSCPSHYSRSTSHW